MSYLLGCARLLLAFLNLLLFVAFAAVGILGLLIKFNDKFVQNLLDKVSSQWSEQQVQDLVKFIHYYGSGLSIAFIVIGFAVAIIALFGVFALFCKNRFFGFIYIALLAILTIIELALIIYLFAIPDNLNKAAFKLLRSSFEHLRTNDSLTEVTFTLWTILGVDGNKLCCGLEGYKDFDEMLPGLQYPPPCCNKNITMVDGQPQAQKCEKTEAANANVEGCNGKVVEFLAENKTLFIGISCGVSIFQFVVLLVMCALYKQWKAE
ncbi:tetraspanin [Echinococcus multilocularis]|uniref:TSP1 n=1 Tax=Echinococcus multilocularis TaxID=6211 RepID=B6VFH3_ECHMU|nr:TSP1 [Echinococcus multilocularis]CDS36461.1 tetraspanin [Echinococcus multilocularis]